MLRGQPGRVDQHGWRSGQREQENDMASTSLERRYLVVGHREELEVSEWVRIHHSQIMPSGGVEWW